MVLLTNDDVGAQLAAAQSAGLQASKPPRLEGNALHDKPGRRELSGWSLQFLEHFPPVQWVDFDWQALDFFLSHSASAFVTVFGGTYKGKVPRYLGNAVAYRHTRGYCQHSFFGLCEHPEGLGSQWTRTRGAGEYRLEKQQLADRLPQNCLAVHADYESGLLRLQRELASTQWEKMHVLIDTCDGTRSDQAFTALESCNLLRPGVVLLLEEAFGYSDAADAVERPHVLPFWEHELGALLRSCMRTGCGMQFLAAAQCHQQLVVELTPPAQGLSASELTGFFEQICS